MGRRVICTNSGRRYRRILIVMLCITMCAAAFYYMRYIDKKIPDSIMLIENRSERFEFNVPVEGEISGAVDVISISNQGSGIDKDIHFNMNKTIIMQANDTGSYNVSLKLFGLFHYKNIQIDIVKEQKVMPSGRAVGLYINSDGIMVLGTSEVEGQDGFKYEPAANILKSGDYIYKINNEHVENIDDVVEVLQKSGAGKVTIHLRRGNSTIKVKVESVLANDGEYKIGAWLREDTEGIGTLTYITKDNKYAALGHGITDIDTGLLIDIRAGGVYPAAVQQVIRGESGAPGEIIGLVRLGDSNKLGTINDNTNYGISGIVSAEEYSYKEDKAMLVAMKQEVKCGSAIVRCQLADSVEDYEIEIEKINLNADDNKGMVIKVTDTRLLDKAGGIVQGMSGSPVIQNGKIVGAVTHVFVNDSTRGYGIFIEDMLS